MTTSVANSVVSLLKPSVILSDITPQNSDDDYKVIEQQLNQYGLMLSLSSVGGVGNCFFYSLARGIMDSPNTWHSILLKKGISDYNTTIFPSKLRSMFVQEISGEKFQHYCSFTTMHGHEYQMEASKFLVEGHYDSSIGNLMPLAMSNALQGCILIIRPKEHHHQLQSPPLLL